MTGSAPLNLAAFLPRDLQAVRQVLHLAAGAGLTTVAELQTLLADRGQAQTPPIRRHALRCARCGAPVVPRPVNVSPATQTGDPADRFVLLCQDRACLHAEYTGETMAQLLRRSTEVLP
jgi:hypothetical protein